MSQIFISYRREDNPEAAGRIYDRLKSHFGEKQVFFDIDSIPPGIDFRHFIRESVSKCDVLLVIIGDRWLAKDDDGVSRLEDPSDFVRIEIEAALQRRIPVIPVPVGRAKEPSKDELPSNIKDLHYRNSCEVRSGTSFEGHIQRLINGIENSTREALTTDRLKQFNGTKARQDGKRRLVGWKTLLGIVLTTVAFFVFWVLSQSDRTTAEFASDVSTEAQKGVSVKELYVLSSLGSPSVAPGEKATISVTVKEKDGRTIEDANVLISSGGGKFLESKNMSYAPASKLQGPFKASGKTEPSGVFTTWWACYPCAGAYVMTVTVSKSGYKDNKSKLTVDINR